jgi:hypothetical protein
MPSQQPEFDPNAAPLSAAYALRELRRGRHERMPVLRNRADGQLLAVIDPKARRVYSRQPVQALVDALAAGDSGFGELDPLSGERQSGGARLADASFDLLCWRFGARLARESGLMPWIAPLKRYRLVRWPDFGEIGNDPDANLLCVVLSQRPLDVAGMVEATQLTEECVHGLLNSLSLCGSLASVAGQSACASAAQRSAVTATPARSGVTATPARSAVTAAPGRGAANPVPRRRAADPAQRSLFDSVWQILGAR